MVIFTEQLMARIGYGAVFQLTPGGAYTNLVFFNGSQLANIPTGFWSKAPTATSMARPPRAARTAWGTIFQLSVPMPPVFKAITLTDGAATLTWSAVAGQDLSIAILDQPGSSQLEQL